MKKTDHLSNYFTFNTWKHLVHFVLPSANISKQMIINDLHMELNISDTSISTTNFIVWLDSVSVLQLVGSPCENQALYSGTVSSLSLFTSQFNLVSSKGPQLFLAAWPRHSAAFVLSISFEYSPRDTQTCRIVEMLSGPFVLVLSFPYPDLQPHNRGEVLL